MVIDFPLQNLQFVIFSRFTRAILTRMRTFGEEWSGKERNAAIKTKQVNEIKVLSRNVFFFFFLFGIVDRNFLFGAKRSRNSVEL